MTWEFNHLLGGGSDRFAGGFSPVEGRNAKGHSTPNLPVGEGFLAASGLEEVLLSN